MGNLGISGIPDHFYVGCFGSNVKFHGLLPRGDKFIEQMYSILRTDQLTVCLIPTLKASVISPLDMCICVCVCVCRGEHTCEILGGSWRKGKEEGQYL